MMRQLKAVFLDVGNTLVHELPSRFEIYAEAARRRGVEIDPEGMTALMREAHRELPRELDGAFRYSDPWFEAYIRWIFHGRLGIDPGELAAITAELFGRFEDPRTFRLFPGADELVDTLRERGLIVGVVSNWSARLPRVLRAVELDTRLDVVVCSAIERLEKPDPAIFDTALGRAGVEAAEALHCGDHVENDVRAARAAGLQAVRVDHAGGPAAAEPDAAPCVGSLGELRSYILDRLP